MQTDLSLIELGDVAHPLLQELIRRAPSTYNHSITVGSIAEAAAEAIGARGLLVRVGAYFHDIGKMLKPGYFIENQSQGRQSPRHARARHEHAGDHRPRQGRRRPGPAESHCPSRSSTSSSSITARRWSSIFYRQANQQKVQEDPDGGDGRRKLVPLPRPQAADERGRRADAGRRRRKRQPGAQEPTPSRIESLVDEISTKRLLDGQFDESGLTLEELRKIGESLVKSLTAVYHGRVKYPDQETA